MKELDLCVIQLCVSKNFIVIIEFFWHAYLIHYKLVDRRFITRTWILCTSIDLIIWFLFNYELLKNTTIFFLVPGLNFYLIISKLDLSWSEAYRYVNEKYFQAHFHSNTCKLIDIYCPVPLKKKHFV
jgi:hypothetical protein